MNSPQLIRVASGCAEICVDISMPAFLVSIISVHIGKRNASIVIEARELIEAREIIELFEAIYGIVESIDPQKPIVRIPVVLGPLRMHRS